MAWRPLPGDRTKTSNAIRKRAMKRLVSAGTPVGILAYEGKQPMAWCSIAPRSTYLPLGGTDYPGIAEGDVWSLVCFFVPRSLRQQGVMTQLLQAALETAQEKGARIVEAYPVDPDSPSYRFMGRVSSFKKAGFTETGRAGKRRHVMHKVLR